jgi:hypothetical protein
MRETLQEDQDWCTIWQKEYQRMGKRKRHHPSEHDLLVYATHEAGEHCSVTPK